MACRTIPLQLPSVGAKTPFSGTSGSMNWNHRNSPRGSKMRPSVFSTREDLRPRLDEYPEGIISGEWTENFSLLSYDDLRVYLQSQVTVHKVFFLASSSVPCSRIQVFVWMAGRAFFASWGGHVDDDRDRHGRSEAGGDRSSLRICVCAAGGRRRAQMHWGHFQARQG